jgi:hypothetical protein
MSLQDCWDGLSPALRRALVLGGALAVLLALVASTPKDEKKGHGDERRRLITNLLSEADPRAIGIEGLVERLPRPCCRALSPRPFANCPKAPMRPEWVSAA